MKRPTIPAAVAALLAVLLGICQVRWAIDGTHSSATAAVLAPLTILAGLALLRLNCLETRLSVILLVGAQLGLSLLALTVGLPGQPRHPVGVAAVTGAVLPLLALAVLAMERRRRHARRALCSGRAPTAPYAR